MGLAHCERLQVFLWEDISNCRMARGGQSLRTDSHSGAGAVGSRGWPMRGERLIRPQRHVGQTRGAQMCKPAWVCGPAALGMHIVGPRPPLISGCAGSGLLFYALPGPQRVAVIGTVPSYHQGKHPKPTSAGTVPSRAPGQRAVSRSAGKWRNPGLLHKLVQTPSRAHECNLNLAHSCFHWSQAPDYRLPAQGSG